MSIAKKKKKKRPYFAFVLVLAAATTAAVVLFGGGWVSASSRRRVLNTHTPETCGTSSNLRTLARPWWACKRRKRTNWLGRVYIFCLCCCSRFCCSWREKWRNGHLYKMGPVLDFFFRSFPFIYFHQLSWTLLNLFSLLHSLFFLIPTLFYFNGTEWKHIQVYAFN